MQSSVPGAEGVKCQHCGRTYKNKRSLRGHVRHHCKRCKSTSPRKCTPAKCKHCSKVFHSANSLRVHASTQHVKEYARSPRSVKEHRAPMKKTRRRSREVRAPEPSGQEASTAALGGQSKTAMDKRLHQYAPSSGDQRSREIWETALRRQHLQNKSTRAGQETS